MGGHDESESDLLPFVLDAEPTAMQQQGQGGGAAFGGAMGPGGAAAAAAAVAGLGGQAGAAGKGGIAQKDVAVGAFLQMLQDAAAAPVGRLDRRQALWAAQQQQQQEDEDRAEGVGVSGGGVPVCVADAAHQVQELAAQLQQLLFPEA
jgi:hypothetical protein